MNIKKWHEKVNPLNYVNKKRNDTPEKKCASKFSREKFLRNRYIFLEFLSSLRFDVVLTFQRNVVSLLGCDYNGVSITKRCCIKSVMIFLLRRIVLIVLSSGIFTDFGLGSY